jgi:hypothetical protein
MKEKAAKGNSESPWSLLIRSFWKIQFINPPEVRGQVLRWLIYGRTMTMPSYQNSKFGSIRK